MPLLTTHNLTQEIDRISAEIRAKPVDASLRLALARLRLLKGEPQKALQQLQTACQFDRELAPEAQLTRMLVRAEQSRVAVFAGKILPDLFALPTPWLEKMMGALREAGEKGEALRREALEEAPPSAGTMGENTRFEWIADGDERLGPVIEVIVGGAYYWVPFEIVESVEIPKPDRVTDLVWTPVELKLIDQEARTVYMPARYPLAEGEETPDVLLAGAETEWIETPQGYWRGRGRRVWYIDGEAAGFYEARRIVIDR